MSGSSAPRSMRLRKIDRLSSVGMPTATTAIFAAVVPPYTDDPLTTSASVIKAVRITELRSRIDAVRAPYGLGPYGYTDPG